MTSQTRPLHTLPDALDSLDDMLSEYPDQKPVLFLDFDGTLAALTSRPEESALTEEVRNTLLDLKSKLSYIGVVSGRDRADVKEKVAIEAFYYAGSHGFDISGPADFHDHLDAANEMLPELDAAEEGLRQALADVEGSLVERKRFAIAIHYRNVAGPEVETVRKAVEEEKQKYSKLKKLGGKKIFELKPDVEWDKGKAVIWLLDHFDVDPARTPVLYLGDDLTDEDAFRALEGKGKGIIVGTEERETYARYKLDSTDEVARWLQALNNRL